jgi:hypothetical protein
MVLSFLAYYNLDLNLNMDWTDFQILYWFFRKSGTVLYLGDIDLLNFTLVNADVVYFVSPENLKIEHPKLKKFQENPEYFDISNLPKKFDRIVNLLPMNIITSFKIMGRFLNLLEIDQKFLVRLEISKRQTKYSNLIINDLLPKFNAEKISDLEIEESEYLIGKKL